MTSFRHWCCCLATHRFPRCSEWVQASLKEALGLQIKIDKQIFKQRLAKMTAGEFDMVLAGWGPDYDDLMTFGDLFASWNLNNRGIRQRRNGPAD